MTDSERLWTGVVLSLFMHFSLTLFHEAPPEETPALRVVLAVDESSSLTPKGTRQGTGLHAASPHDREEAEKLDRKRRAYLRYIEDVDEAVHARRLASGEKDLIGVALCAFTINRDGSFSDVRLVASSGRPQLDASALRLRPHPCFPACKISVRSAIGIFSGGGPQNASDPFPARRHSPFQ